MGSRGDEASVRERVGLGGRPSREGGLGGPTRMKRPKWAAAGLKLLFPFSLIFFKEKIKRKAQGKRRGV